MNKKISLSIISLLLLVVILLFAFPGNKTYKDPYGNIYKYKLTVTGTMPNAKAETKFVILSNEANLTFDDVANSFLSSNSNDHLDIYLVTVK
ncbi:MAG: hypothetical protein KIC47_05615 [Clostridium sp.]|uniref:hypothetical protein n=1 Tax=Clostridium sp. TaxID=1506 RepID=UPI001DE11716|nr:hypothetical protein [Clostridium sp.]MBS5936748.1 hypothetical protein [Clostridium sp.]MBS5949784.1 hypothetical protein [Clostridium sp.]